MQGYCSHEMLTSVRQCDGYQARCSEQESIPPPANVCSFVAVAPPGQFRGTGQERRCFNFFRTRTAPHLAGFFDTSFWENLLPRATFYEPVLRHAMLALSSLHERFESRDGIIHKTVWSTSEGGFALQQYNQAIRQITKPGDQRPHTVDVCLIACMLFACFEVRSLYLNMGYS